MKLSQPKKKKLYCYVDETGQDAASSVFVVVAVVSLEEQEKLKRTVADSENASGTGGRKWHKSQAARRLRYLTLLLQKEIGRGEVFFGSYKKPLPYFFPLLDILEKSIKIKAPASYIARIFVDGIDRKKAKELTNALRQRNISLELVRNRRDESEPLIRLADMWAGCIRAALSGSKEEQEILKKALSTRYLKEVTENTP